MKIDLTSSHRCSLHSFCGWRRQVCNRFLLLFFPVQGLSIVLCFQTAGGRGARFWKSRRGSDLCIQGGHVCLNSALFCTLLSSSASLQFTEAASAIQSDHALCLCKYTEPTFACTKNNYAYITWPAGNTITSLGLKWEGSVCVHCSFGIYWGSKQNVCVP